MLDGGLVVGYFTAFLLRGARRLADRAFESGLDRLADVVESRIGRRSLDRLEENPGDADVAAQVGGRIEQASRIDPAFACELTNLVAELDRRGGRQIINEVYAETNVQAFDHGIAVGRDFTYVEGADPTDISGAPGWVKFCIALGSLVAVSGLGVFFYTLFTVNTDLNDPNFGETPPGIPHAFGIFFVGFVLLGIGSIGRAMRKRR